MKKIVALSIILLLGSVCLLSAGQRVTINIKTILASQGERFVDPKLSRPLMGELRSVFKYSSYRFISGNRMRLGLGETGIARLPGGRTLKVTPKKIRNQRVEFNLEIFKGNRRIFQTTVHLLNQSNIIVGGPRHKGGVLLFSMNPKIH